MTKTYNFNGRTEYIDKTALASAPVFKSKAKLQFFKVDHDISCADLEREYSKLGLVPASVEMLCKYDKKNRKQMDEMKYIATQWKDADGNWCYVAFSRWCSDGRDVDVDRLDFDWDNRWWFAGLE